MITVKRAAIANPTEAHERNGWRLRAYPRAIGAASLPHPGALVVVPEKERKNAGNCQDDRSAKGDRQDE
jgi:hypothetical protein